MTQYPRLPTEQALLDGLDAYTLHADEAAELLPSELDPQEQLKGSAEHYEAPFAPLADGEHSDSVYGERNERE